MTITAAVSESRYAGSGTTGPFAYNYRIFAATDLRVIKRSSAGVETVLAYPAAYSVANIGSATGSITTTAAIVAGETLVIRRVRPITQEKDIRNTGAYLPEVQEDALDHLVMIDLQQQHDIDRALKLDESLDASLYDLRVPGGTAGQVLGLNSAATGLAWLSAASAASAYITGAGSPEGLITAAVGTLYIQNDGANGKTLWRKRTGSGNTGWALMQGDLGAVNVKDYGAVGDGAANDTAAIQAAVNVTGLIYFPPGNYKIDAVTVPSNCRLIGLGGPSACTITQRTAGQDLFIGNGTQAAHKSRIEITGFKFVGIENPIARHVVLMSWVDYLSVHHNSFENVYLVNLGYAGESYATISETTLQHHIDVSDNDFSSTITSDANVLVFLKFCRDFTIQRNRFIGMAGFNASALECWGGNAQVAGDGPLANGRKCLGGSISDNTLENFVAAIGVVQSKDIVVNGNTCYTCGEAIGAIGCFDVIFSGNVIFGGSHCTFVTGINKNVTFSQNIIRTTSKDGPFYITGEAAYTSGNNVGPISFVDNEVTIVGVGGQITISGIIGHMIFKRNTLYNCHAIMDGSMAITEVEDNTLIFNLFSVDYPNYLMRVGGYNTPVIGLPDNKVYTSVRRNKLIDRTMAFVQRGIFMGDPGVTSQAAFEENVFEMNSGSTPIDLATSDAVIALTAAIRRNRFPVGGGGGHSQGTATNWTVLSSDNLDLNGNNSVGAVPGSGRWSVGSIIKSNDPATDKVLGWICTVSGTPGTWSPIGPIYSIGTWTPLLVGTGGAVTPSSQVGYYTKVGRLVTVQFYHTGTLNTATGPLTITGLPFASLGYVVHRAGLWLLGTGVAKIDVSFGISAASTVLTLYGLAAANVDNQSIALNAADITGSFQFGATFSYVTSA